MDDTHARHAATTAHNAAAAAGADPTACLDAALDAYRDHLHPAAATPSSDPEAAARWLAEVSGHPRYSREGWRRLLVDSVEHAANAAAARYAGQPDILAEVTGARDLLLAHHHRTTQVGG